ncbi:hypothetical protein LCG56_05690 [Pseudomonas cannabina pv. alisalensis]|uniref:Uncharacterized protein n=1 Tax=Pseudomonas syringae pv. maculicola str. ES4326 TaxID=629265 RepID=A0A8T8C347_PSEYM|nr:MULTISPECIES: hypothetical protein [Pseudomonas syringae group]QHE97948.1 hypothetical protein PMA4326_015950 [Pseudomonas syringae pv. maculicola str. ES4326]UBY98619.1 hypothetical protein LCG56_05690 [Pseudomonas cannabina pv. alisalensis]
MPLRSQNLHIHTDEKEPEIRAAAECVEMERRDIEQLNIDLMGMFGWWVDIAEQLDCDGLQSQYLRLYRVSRADQPSSKKTYIGPMPIDMPDFAIKNAGWLCRDYYFIGYKQGRRDEGRFRRRIQKGRR